MTDIIDLSLAESVYLALLDAQHKPSVAAADLVRALKSKTQNSGNQSAEIETAQATACAPNSPISQSITSDPNTTP